MYVPTYIPTDFINTYISNTYTQVTNNELKIPKNENNV